MGGGAGNESPSLMSTLNLWRLCWWSGGSAPVHSKTESLQSSAGGGGWTGPGMAKLAALALAVGGFHNLSTEVVMQAAPGSLAFALVRDSNPTSWLPLSWLWEGSICLVMDAVGIETGLDIGRYWAQRFERNMRPEKKKKKQVKGQEA